MEKIKLLKKELNGTKGKDRVNKLNELAFALHNSEPLKTEEYASEALKLSKEINYKKGIARSFNIVGISFHIRGDFSEAMQYYTNSLTIFEELGDLQKIASAKHNIGSLNEKLGNYEIALENYLAALKIWESSNNLNHLSASYNNIGVIYEKLESIDLAMEFHLKSLKLKKELGDNHGISMSYLNLGIIYNKQNNTNEALVSINKAVEIKKEIGDTKGLAAAYVNMGRIYQENNDLKQSLKFAELALESFIKIGNKFGIASSKTSIGKIYIQQKNYTTASKFLNEALDLAIQIEAKELQAFAFLALSELFEDERKYKKALQLYKKYYNVRHEIINEQKNEQISVIQDELITELKSTKNELIQERNFAESIIDTAQAIVLLLDTEGKILKYNRYLEEISGYKLEEMKGKDWFSNFIPSDETIDVKVIFDKAIKNDKTKGNITKIITKDTSIRMIEWFDTTLRDSKNEVIGLLAVGHDVTERLNSEENLKNSKKLIKKITSILRHDITNDLIVIKSALKIYKNNNDEEMLNEIDKRVKDSIKLIQKQRSRESYVDVYSHLTEQCLESVISDVSKSFKDIEINVKGSGCVYADSAIYAIFENLFQNSVKHGKTKKVNIEITQNEDRCIIKFADFGIGIGPATGSGSNRTGTFHRPHTHYL